MPVEAVAIEVVTRKECQAWLDEAREVRVTRSPRTQSLQEMSYLRCANCKAEFAYPRAQAFRLLKAHYEGNHAEPVRQVLSFEEASAMDATLRAFGYSVYRETKDKRRYNGPGGAIVTLSRFKVYFTTKSGESMSTRNPVKFYHALAEKHGALQEA